MLGIVVVVLLAAEGGVRWLEPALPAREHSEVFYKRDQYRSLAHKGASLDVVGVGASMMDAGFDPATFDQRSTRFRGSYNGSIRGAESTLMDEWVNRSLAPEHRPRLIILGIHPLQVGKAKGALDELNLLTSKGIDVAIRQTTVRRWSPLQEDAEHWSALVRQRSLFFRPGVIVRAVRDRVEGRTAASQQEEQNPTFWSRNMTGRGYNAQYASQPDEATTDTNMASLLNKLYGGGYDLGGLEATLRGLRRPGTQVVLVLTPMDRTTLIASGWNPVPYAKASADIALLTRRLGVPMLDLSDRVWESSLFHDKLHLDQAGADRFSAEVADWVNQLCTDWALRSCPSPT